MRFGVYLPTFGELANPRRLAELAVAAEVAGWDGFFMWDHIVMWDLSDEPVADTTVALAAIAAATRTIRFGPIVTAVPRRRPWKLARETASLDVLSDGRLIVGVGTGLGDAEWAGFGEESTPQVRGSMLDEGLEVLDGLWTGEPFSYRGAHYRVDTTRFTPRPVQRPRIPVWVCGSWPIEAPFRRAARWDGVWPMLRDAGPFDVSVEQVREIVAFTAAHRTVDTPFDVIQSCGGPPEARDRAAAHLSEYAAAGVTWWVELIDPFSFGWGGSGPWPVRSMEERIAAGPPGA